MYALEVNHRSAPLVRHLCHKITAPSRDPAKVKKVCDRTFMYTLIVTAKMNDIDPQEWLADVLVRLPNITVSRVYELLPWNWKAEVKAVKAA
jgi:hypothetical protein